LSTDPEDSGTCLKILGCARILVAGWLAAHYEARRAKSRRFTNTCRRSSFGATYRDYFPGNQEIIGIVARHAIRLYPMYENLN